MSQSNNYYYLYGVERVGLASGYKYFGKADWYKLGTESLLRSQNDDGSWGGKWGSQVVSTSFALLFLSRGRHPVLVNKLEFDGDWNNRPRDMAMLSRWMSRKFEKEMAWQIINLQVPVSQWHDAPLLYLSGSKPPKFTDEDLQKLKEFVHQGGTILSVAECPRAGGMAFATAMKRVYADLFPEYELKPVAKDHPLFGRETAFDVETRVDLQMLSNGVRPLVIHSDDDLSLSWQLKLYDQGEHHFQAFANIASYVTDKFNLRHRGVTHWPGKPDVTPAATIKVARLKHAGNHDPEPLAYVRFARHLLAETGIGLEVLGPIDIGSLPASGAKVATLTGTGKLTLTDAQKQALKAFVTGGGTLLVDAAGGNDEFANSATDVLQTLFEGRWRVVPSTAPMHNIKGLQDQRITYRRRTQSKLGAAAGPRVRSIEVGDRHAVILSRLDITGGLVGYQSYAVDGYSPGGEEDPGGAYRILRNLLFHAVPSAREQMTLTGEQVSAE
jgi:hypothetical protein